MRLQQRRLFRRGRGKKVDPILFRFSADNPQYNVIEDSWHSRTTLATYRDAAGVQRFGPHNLATNSRDFTNGVWLTHHLSSATANTTVAPDGSQTGSTVAISVDGFRYRAFSGPSETYVFSVWLKGTPGEHVGIRLFGSTSGAAGLLVALTATWTQYQISGVMTGTSVSFGFDKRGVVVGANAAAAAFQAWEAKLEYGRVASTTTLTTTNAARFDSPLKEHYAYDRFALGHVQTLLTQGQRSNLVPNSEDLRLIADGGTWSATGGTLTVSSEAGPSGKQAYTFSGGGTGIYRNSPGASVSTGRYSIAVDMKAGTSSMGFVRDLGSTSFAHFNLSTGVVAQQPTPSNTFARMEPWPNGWYRCIIEGPVPASVDPHVFFGVVVSHSGTIHFSRPQHELGDASTHIPTYGTTVTRTSDSLIGTYPHDRRPISGYMRFWNGGPNGAVDSGLLQIGGNFGNCILIDHNNSAVRLYHAIPGFTGGAYLSPIPPIGSMVELLFNMGEDAAGTFQMSVNRASPVSYPIASAAGSGWATGVPFYDNQLFIGTRSGDGNMSVTGTRDIIIADGNNRDFNYFRALVSL